VLLVDKPAGPTSHDVVDQVRDAIGVRRVGHTGTLDPFATGLLLVLLGRATRLAPFLVGLEKRYTGVMRLGAATDTDDATGVIITESDRWRELSDTDITSALDGLTGWQQQRPPDFSAMKIAGQRAYRRVRRGEAVALPAREIMVDTFRMTARNGADVSFDVRVSSGTYVRALARDLGERLGCGGHLVALRRIEIGPFLVSNAHALDDVSGALVRPAADAVMHLPRITVTEREREALAHGRSLHRASAPTTAIAAVDGSELLAVLEPREDGLLHPRVVLVAQ
jgi:tRNA pseudouridine55 synthase